MKFQPMTRSEILDSLNRLSIICFFAAFAVLGIPMILGVDNAGLDIFAGASFAVLGAVLNAAQDYIDREQGWQHSLDRTVRRERLRHPAL